MQRLLLACLVALAAAQSTEPAKPNPFPQLSPSLSSQSNTALLPAAPASPAAQPAAPGKPFYGACLAPAARAPRYRRQTGAPRHPGRLSPSLSPPLHPVSPRAPAYPLISLVRRPVHVGDDVAVHVVHALHVVHAVHVDVVVAHDVVLSEDHTGPLDRSAAANKKQELPPLRARRPPPLPSAWRCAEGGRRTPAPAAAFGAPPAIPAPPPACRPGRRDRPGRGVNHAARVAHVTRPCCCADAITDL